MLLETRGAAVASCAQQKTSRVDIHLNADQVTHDQIDELQDDPRERARAATARRSCG